MPFFKTIVFNPFTEIHIWKITEDYDDLMDQTQLSDLSLVRLNHLKTNAHQLGFLSVRLLLQQIGYSDFDLEYGFNGKPFLKNGHHISISHSFGFSVIIISNKNVGVDIELIRNKIVGISEKFCGLESGYLDQKKSDYEEKLTVIWGAKEAVFKLKNQNGLSFKNHIQVLPFELFKKQLDALVITNELIENYTAFFEKIENYILVFAVDNH